MHAPPKPDYPVAEPNKLLDYDAVLFGIPTRYGNFPAQWKAFWDKTGGIWASGGFWGKYAGLFVSTGTQGGGQESTALATMSTLTHHGFIYVPLGYKTVFPILSNLNEARGGSAWGAGTFAVRTLCPPQEHVFSDWPPFVNKQGADGSRQPSSLELELAEAQGKAFYETVSKVNHQWIHGSDNQTPGGLASDQQQEGMQKAAKKEERQGGPCGLPKKCNIIWPGSDM